MSYEILFERCPHDTVNPYVMVSRAMAQDPSISPKAKGVLLYLLSLPSDWKIYHSQLQKALNIGEESLNSAMQELLDNGYADRERVKKNGQFQPYIYRIREFKKCSPDRVSRTGFSGPENPVIQSKKNAYTKETTAQAAAVFPGKATQKQAACKIHECLQKVDIPEPDKQEISKRYTEQTVSDALEWASHQESYTKGLCAAIKYGCKMKLKHETNTKPKTNYEKVRSLFEHGKIYNGAECYLTKDYIAFERGTRNEKMSIDKFFKISNLVELCGKFGIKIRHNL